MLTMTEVDDESMIVPMIMLGVIVLFGMYACCGPAPNPNREPTHSMGSTRDLMRDKSE